MWIRHAFRTKTTNRGPSNIPCTEKIQSGNQIRQHANRQIKARRPAQRITWVKYHACNESEIPIIWKKKTKYKHTGFLIADCDFFSLRYQVVTFFLEGGGGLMPMWSRTCYLLSGLSFPGLASQVGAYPHPFRIREGASHSQHRAAQLHRPPVARPRHRFLRLSGLVDGRSAGVLPCGLGRDPITPQINAHVRVY